MRLGCVTGSRSRPIRRPLGGLNVAEPVEKTVGGDRTDTLTAFAATLDVLAHRQLRGVVELAEGEVGESFGGRVIVHPIVLCVREILAWL